MTLKHYLLFTILAVFTGQCLADQGEYAFILKARGNPFWKTISDGIKEGITASGIKGSLYQIDEDRNSETQLNLCNTIIEKKPAIIVLGAVTKAVGIECYKKALAKGIKVADIDGNVSVNEAKEAGLELAFSVGSDNFLIGQTAAIYLNSINKISTPSILIIEGLAGNTVSKKRVEGFQTKALELIPNAKIIASIAGDWDRLKASNVTQDILTREKNLNYIFSASDVMTYGIIEAIKVAKRGEVKVISVDAQFQILNSVKSGKLEATVAQLPYLMGRRAVELSIKAVRDNLTGHTEFTDIPVVNKEFLEKSDNPTLKFIK